MSATDQPPAPEGPLGHLDLGPGAVHPIGRAVHAFVDELRGLREIVPLLSKTAKGAETEFRLAKREQVAEGLVEAYDEEGSRPPHRHSVDFSLRSDYLLSRVAATGLRHAERDLGSAMFLMMSAHFDRFVGDMVRAVFEIKPELRKDLRHEMSFTDLDELPDLDAALALVIEREIEAILGRGRTEQIEWFVSRCGMSKPHDLLISELEDVASLRDVIAHHGGRLTNKVEVSLQGRDSRLLSRYPVGHQVLITSEDLDAAHDALFLTAVAISQGAWRNIRDDQRENADDHFHVLTYTLLALEEFSLAQRTLTFGMDFGAAMGETYRLLNTVNLAQTYKWLGDPAGCDDVLSAEEWDTHSESYQLAVATLNEEWVEAERLMGVCTQGALLDRSSFEEWPLFRKFRHTDEFRRAFSKAFPPRPTD